MVKMSDHTDNNYRREYGHRTLNEQELPDQPFELFHSWLQDAIDLEVQEPYAMNLATVDIHQKPSSRIVLMRSWSPEGFVFFTNYLSRKGTDLESNPFAALTFFWPELERQVRVEGRTKRTSSRDSTAYFSTRPLESQISASISEQSRPVPDRRYLENLFDKRKSELGMKAPGRPDWWGGFILEPQVIEFWQGRPYRLHDRIQYQLLQQEWTWKRLAP